jgi:hypothetical protein
VRLSLFCSVLQATVCSLVEGVWSVDLKREEKVEAELDRLIEGRLRNGDVDPGEQKEL